MGSTAAPLPHATAIVRHEEHSSRLDVLSVEGFGAVDHRIPSLSHISSAKHIVRWMTTATGGVATYYIVGSASASFRPSVHIHPPSARFPFPAAYCPDYKHNGASFRYSLLEEFGGGSRPDAVSIVAASRR